MRTSRSLAGLALSVLTVAGAILVPVQSLAQTEVESPAGDLLDVTASSAEAADKFWSALDDIENIFPRRAVMTLEETMRLDPGMGLAHVLYGQSTPGLTREEREEYFSTGLAALSHAPTAELLTGLGLRAQSNGEPEEARMLYKAAQLLVPADPHVAYRIALLTGTIDGQAIGFEAMNDMIETFPDFAPAWNILGYQRWAMGDEEGAIEALERYLKLAPQHPNSHDSYGEILQWAGRWDDAAAHYRRALELDPGYQAAYTGLAEIAQLSGDGEAAREFLTQQSQFATTPQNAIHTRRAIANSYVIDGNFDRALEVLTAAAAEAEAEGYTGVARLTHQQAALIAAADGDADQARAHLDRSWDLDGANTPFQAAVTMFAMASAGDVTTATEALEALADEVGDASNWRTTLLAGEAAILLAQEDYGDADELLAKTDPQNAYARALLAECEKELDHEAIADNLAYGVVHDSTLNLFNPFAGVAVAKADGL